MPHFAILWDPDPERRSAVGRAISHRFAREAGLVRGERVSRQSWLGWATGPRVPVSTSSEAGAVTLLLGAPLGPDAEEASAPGAIGRLFDEHGVGSGPEGALNGFFVAMRAEASGVAIRGDLLGLFPIYHRTADGVFMAASSPHLFDAHPYFPHRLDAIGLAGILLTQGPVAGRMPLEDVHRLAPGVELRWTPETGVTVHRRFEFPVGVRDEESPFREQLDIVADAVDDAVRHALSASDAYAVLLSGGRDSRMLAGFASETRLPGVALVGGGSADYERIAAARVARRLGLDLRSHDPVPHSYVESARRSATWEPMAGGWSNVHLWQLVEPLSDLPPVCLNGLLVDTILGGVVFFPDEHDGRRVSFDRIFAHAAQSGVKRERLCDLFRPPLRDAIDAAVKSFRRAYRESSPDPAERPWRFQLAHAERFGIGGNAWRTSFGSWPLMPVLDSRVLHAVAGVGQGVLAQRRGQDEILRTRFPGLARIPHVIDNEDLGLPLLPGWRDRIVNAIRKPFRPSTGSRARRRERRTNWRTYDFNGAGWRAIRREAEPDRDSVAGLLDMDALDRYLPGPDETPVSHTFFDLMGRQVIVGLILWARENL